jgi:pyroglutamyl-peptidase
MKILVSGFETFGHHLENSSEIIVKLFQERRPEISAITLPVTFKDSWPTLREKIDLEKPDYVICLGLAGNRKVISLEKVAINWIDCDIADNAGVVIKEQLIDSEAPTAYFSTLPISDFKKK